VTLRIKVKVSSSDEFATKVSSKLAVPGGYSMIRTKPLMINGSGQVDTGMQIAGAIVSTWLMDLTPSDLDANGNLIGTSMVIEEITPVGVSGGLVTIGTNHAGRYAVLTFLAGSNE
jgi:hypothetical protein